MAPNLPRWKHDQIYGMVRAGFPDAAIKDAVKCSRNTLGRIRSNLDKYGSTTPSMRDAVREYLRIWPDRYLDQLVVYLADEFDTLVSVSTISRELKRMGLSKKRIRQIAQQRLTGPLPS
jgi:Winged helix-turn helix